MLFNSVEFLLFFPIVTALFFMLPHSWRWLLLLVASCFFYMFFKPEYILILGFTIVIDYFAGILLENEKEPGRRKWYLIASLIANIGVLAVFKYYNFINDNITGLAKLFNWHNTIPYLSIVLPIGLSFHTFQAMSYTIEVYRGHQKAERHFGIYALYVMFYPQLVAGPIERPQNILPQFRIEQFFTYENAVLGFNLILYGLFKKIVVADRLALYVNQVYADIPSANTISALLAVVFFSIQIYCDFSGYSDIARGTAKVMGYDLMVNFDRPYLAKSIREFWTRWHISLSTWFRDYLYIPLGGNRGGKLHWYRNLLIVFVISGLWHGANWTFIIWGALHGFYLIIGLTIAASARNSTSAFTASKLKLLKVTLRQIGVFSLVSFSWIFFRSANLQQALAMIKKILSCDFSLNLTQICAQKGPLNLIICFFVIGALALSYLLPKNLVLKYNVAFLSITTLLILFLGQDGTTEFIYFQF